MNTYLVAILLHPKHTTKQQRHERLKTLPSATISHPNVQCLAPKILSHIYDFLIPCLLTILQV